MKRNRAIIIITLLVIFLIMYLYSTSATLGSESGVYAIPISYDETLEKTPLEKALADRNGETLNSLPILMFHVFYNASAGERGRNSNWMEISAFEKQMRYLSEAGYKIAKMLQLRKLRSP